jgi:hypothetical protein
VGDPLTLTLTLSGDLNLDDAFPPLLSAQTNLTADFRIYDRTVRTVRREETVDYLFTIRPLRAGALELPPIAVSYFDPDRRAVRTVHTRPIPVRARPSAELDLQTVIPSVERPAAVRPAPAPSDVLPVAPLKVSRNGAVSVPLTGDHRLALVFAAAPALYGALCAMRGVRRCYRKHAPLRRRKRAAPRAVAGLRRARRAAAADPARARGLLLASLRRYPADRFGVEPEGLTPADVRRIFSIHGISDPAAAQYGEVFDRIFNAAYAPTAPSGRDLAPVCDTARQLIVRIEKETRSP